MGSISDNVPYGRRLIPVTIDEIARETPDRVFTLIPRSSNLQDGYMDVTYGVFARAVDRASAWLEVTFGRSESFETLSYIGPFDLRYYIVVLGATKVGFKTLLPSPRNSLEGQLNLLRSTECKHILTAKGYSIPKDVIAQSGLQPISIPELDFFLAPGHAKHYPFTKTVEEAANDPFIIMHTSGSTGLPKPIVLKHAWPFSLDMHQTLPSLDGYRGQFPVFGGRRAFGGLPPFHAAGLDALLIFPVWYGCISIWGPANRPISAVLVDEVLDVVQVDAIFVAPSILEDLIQSQDSIAKLEKLQFIAFGGGPLDHNAGKLLASKTHLVNCIGTTEICAQPIYSKANEDWEYFHYNPIHKGIEFRSMGDGTYEQVIVRHPSTDHLHSTWWTFPEKKEYFLNDLYTKHPSKPNLWIHVGRADDVIVLSNGEKLNPTSMERTLQQNQNVKGALVVGQGRFAPAAIIELKDKAAQSIQSPEQKAQFLEQEIWPYAVEANRDAPAHAQLSQDKLILSDPAKPFGRAGKGTVLRPMTVKMYADEIEELYRRSEEDDDNVDVPKIDLSQDMDSSQEEQLASLVENVIKIKSLELDEDFFAAGMDSLHVMTIAKQLKAALIGIPHEKINTRLIYSHPTVRTLTAALKQLSVSNGHSNGTLSREQKIEETLQRFVERLPAAATTNKPSQRNASLTILLTGSTGSLGSHLLHTLLSSSNVQKVYCLNRRPDAEQHQAKSNAERELVSKWDDRVKFLHADLSLPSLGLKEDQYQRLVNEVSVIIHNQWRVDFNLSLPSFLPHITGVLNLITLSSSSPISLPIFFTSSIGALGNWSSLHPNKSVPEEALTDPSITPPQGYSESKWISERLLQIAGERGVRSAVLRVGQIAGPVETGVRGVWNKQEWLPTLIASSIFLGVIPQNLPSQDEIEWIPVDILSEIIFDLVEADLKDGEKDDGQGWTHYYHLSNPTESSWKNLVPAIQAYYSNSKKTNGTVNGNSKTNDGVLKAVPFSEWIQRLEESGRKDGVDLERNPALKLLDFYHGMNQGGHPVKMDTAVTKGRSQKMKRLQGVRSEWMELWLKQWGF